MSRIRVLVVEDSVTTRKYLIELLASQDYVEVVGEAADGKTAIEMCEALRPDVVTMDMVLPVMSGVAATEYIMSFCPTPILIVSSSVNRAEIYKTYDALAAGAVDVLSKPDADADESWAREFYSALRVVSRVSVVTRRRPAAPESPPPPVPRGLVAAGTRRVIAIGASTGGPGAVLSIVRALPTDCRLPVLLVLHIGEPFGKALSSWLDDQSGLTIRYAESGERVASIPAGHVLMAPPNRHLEVVGARLVLGDGPERHSCRPSVDVLFSSVAASLGAGAIGCLLTGMGRDGAAGLLEMRRAGAFTIAQDEATSVVYGMPGEAARLDAADAILPLDEIGRLLARVAEVSPESAR